MDIILCIFFGLLTAGITSSLFENNQGTSLTFILITGAGSGLAASFIGVAGGWSNLTLFNLYNVLISIVLAMVVTGFYQVKLGRRNKALGIVPEPIAD